MSDLISKGKLFNALATAQSKGEVFAVLQSMPTEDAEYVVHGHWKFDFRDGKYYCSECEKQALCDDDGAQIPSDYCPHCNAKMEGVAE